jgi:hypothetical protein
MNLKIGYTGTAVYCRCLHLGLNKLYKTPLENPDRRVGGDERRVKMGVRCPHFSQTTHADEWVSM